MLGLSRTSYAAGHKSRVTNTPLTVQLRPGAAPQTQPSRLAAMPHPRSRTLCHHNSRASDTLRLATESPTVPTGAARWFRPAPSGRHHDFSGRTTSRAYKSVGLPCQAHRLSAERPLVPLSFPGLITGQRLQAEERSRHPRLSHKDLHRQPPRPNLTLQETPFTKIFKLDLPPYQQLARNRPLHQNAPNLNSR
jgi:hypothetical protein